MAIKTILNYSPNFTPKKRTPKKIKFIIIHYTGMEKESSAIKHLTNIQSEVSSHYLVKNNGDIISLVPNLYTAWHAGKSYWKNYILINDKSIGIEISNPGHQFFYKKFHSKQIKSLIRLINFLKKKYHIKNKYILGHSDIAPDRKKDPGEKFPWEFLSRYQIGLWHSLDKKLLKKYRLIKINNLDKMLFLKYLTKIGYFFKKNKTDSISLITKAFQRRFRQQLINGKIDLECLEIAKNLVKYRFN
mgnify:CR=1 FL=1